MKGNKYPNIYTKRIAILEPHVLATKQKKVIANLPRMPEHGIDYGQLSRAKKNASDDQVTKRTQQIAHVSSKNLLCCIDACL